MGCTTSKLNNRDTVCRCKERRRLIKDAVFARHHLAAAHADYCRSLRVTGIALSDFAASQPLLVVSPSTPSVLIHYQPSKSPFSLSSPRPPTNTDSNLPHILSASSVKISSPHHHHHQSGEIHDKIRVKKGPKLPHILSDSSVCSSTPKSFSGNFDFFPAEKETMTYVGVPHSNYSSTLLEPFQHLTSALYHWWRCITGGLLFTSSISFFLF